MDWWVGHHQRLRGEGTVVAPTATVWGEIRRGDGRERERRGRIVDVRERQGRAGRQRLPACRLHNSAV